MCALKKGSIKIVREKWEGPTDEVEFWGFRTRPDKRKPGMVAWDFVQENARLLNLEGSLDTLDDSPAVIRSLGARHVLFQQERDGLPINRGYVTVHMDNDGRVYLVKNHAVPEDQLKPEPGEHLLNEKAAQTKALKEFSKDNKRLVRDSGRERLRRTEKMLYWKERKLYPAFRCRLLLRQPRKEWIVYIDARWGTVLDRFDALARARALARVFDPSPAYRFVTLCGPLRRGRLESRYVTTKPTRWRSHGRFFYASGQRRFSEVMAYYHINAVARYLDELGYKGYRRILGVTEFKERRGKRLGGAVQVDACGTRMDNSWYSPGCGLLTFGYGGIKDAEDGDVIVHELGHAIQDAICPGFGQSAQAMAMGEGFGDYLAASHFAAKKTAADRTWLMTWGFTLPDKIHPYTRRVNERRSFKHYHESADEHVNGEIWSATLWDIREALGRKIADTLIIESHFQLDAFTTFDRGARAILDADQNIYRRKYRQRLVRIFHAQGIKPVTRWD